MNLILACRHPARPLLARFVAWLIGRKTARRVIAQSAALTGFTIWLVVKLQLVAPDMLLKWEGYTK